MASNTNHSILAQILLGLLIMSVLDFTVDLYNRNNIRRMRIYDPYQPTLQALAGSNIELMLGVPNTDLQSVASSQENANNWVRDNVINHPNVRFRYISVGNEVSPLRDESRQYVNVLLPALQNIRTAISAAGLNSQIRVSSAIDTGLLENAYPPVDGIFRSDVIPFVDPIIRFLVDTQAPLFVNLYPYFSYTGSNGEVDLQYALFNSEGIIVPDGSRYQNLFVAILDATYAAVARRGGSTLEIVVSESGWPSAGESAATLDNARTYYTNLVQRVRSGTPRRPGPIETYIFSMFDEDQRSPEIERNFGLFRPNMEPKYPITFN